MTTVRFALLLVLASCGGGRSLDRDEVTSIPAGTGTGSAASGNWAGTLATTACTGSCLIAGVVSLCDVGDLDDYELELVQTDGHLAIEAEGLATPSMVGGIDADGTFRVGGYATQLGGMIESLSETSGQVAGDTFTGTVIASSEGSYDGNDFACDAEYTTHGERGTGDDGIRSSAPMMSTHSPRHSLQDRRGNAAPQQSALRCASSGSAARSRSFSVGRGSDQRVKTHD